ncbi:hypothetical protein F4677DRAFT_438227, partial [Hypoxylon crocopeplum]
MSLQTQWLLPPTTRDEFRIAIFCALPKEAKAVEAVCDTLYSRDFHQEYGKVNGDQNKYSTGRIINHAVVIVWLGHMGKVSSATAAAHLQMSFRNIRRALLVGICGGCPKNHKGEDVLLGDVIVSSKIYQYDFKKLYPDEDDIRDTEEHMKHDPNVSAEVERLAAGGGREFTRGVVKHVKELSNKSGMHLYGHPGCDKDILYEPRYLHKHRKRNDDDAGCEECDKSEASVCKETREKSCIELGCELKWQVCRPRLEGIKELPNADKSEALNPRVHFGIMGCGDTVIKSGQHRDEIAKRLGIIAVEMESAGMFRSFPGVVIKSVCDYADSHKNKSWQEYAAGTAACAAKALLENDTPIDRKTTESPSQVPSGSLPPNLPAACYEKRPPSLKHRVCVNFIERQDILGRMEKIIFHEMPKGQQKQFVLCGIAGSGKTQLCRRFANIHEGSNFWGVFQVDASSPATADSDLGAIAKWAGLAATREDGKMFLSNCPDGWLLIIDNADGMGPAVKELFPEGDIGCIIITTRNVGLPYNQIDLNKEPLSIEDGITLFLKDANQDAEDKQNRFDAQPVVERLGCLPLALTHAAAVIRGQRCSLGDAVEYYNRNMEKLLKSAEDVTNTTYEHCSIYASIEMSLQNMLTFKGSKILDRAIEILQLCAFFHFRDVPEQVLHSAPSWSHRGVGRLFQDYLSKLQASFNGLFNRRALLLDKNKYHAIDQDYVIRALSSITSLPSHSPELSDPSRQDENREALALLNFYGLGCFDARTGLFSMHPVFHEWTCCRLTNQDAQWARWSAGVALSHSISWPERGDSDFEQGKLRRRLLAHVDFYLGSGIASLSTHNSLSTYQAEVAEKFALVYQDNGNYGIARVLFQGSVDTNLRALGRESTKALKSLHRLSIVLEKQRDHKTAEEYSRTAFEGFKALLGEKSNEALECLGTYASSLHGLGKFSHAEDMNRLCLRVRSELTTEDTANTIEIKNNLAMAILQQDKSHEAVDLLIQAYHWRKQNYGDHNTDTMQSLHDMALAYGRSGEIHKAVEIGYQVLDCRKKVLGNHHPDTLSSITELSLAEIKLGHREAAMNLSLEASKALAQCMGSANPDTLQSLSSLAGASRELGQYKYAEDLYRAILEGFKKHFTPDHPDILKTMSSLASVLKDRGQYDEAVHIYREALSGFKAQHGLHHRDVIQCQINLALVLARLNDEDRHNEANDIHREIDSKIGRSYPGHDILKSEWLFNYSVFLRKRGNYDKAREKVLEAVKGYIAKLGPRSSAVIDSIASHAFLLNLQENYGEAWKEYRKALKGYKELGDHVSPHRNACLERFATMQDKMKKLGIPEPGDAHGDPSREAQFQSVRKRRRDEPTTTTTTTEPPRKPQPEAKRQRI